MRTNKVLNLGNFELDWDEGRVMFRVSNLFQPNRVDERIVSGLVYAAVAEMDRLTPFLSIFCRTPAGELLLLRITELMSREDLLPPEPKEEDTPAPRV
jgi:hypothetical protein